ncbi:hypothetical protein B4Q13_24740 [Lacticaseibacillus rhamnosus]
MRQARGRYSGSRDSGQRQPHHVKKSPANRQGQPYAKGPPPREPAQPASLSRGRRQRAPLPHGPAAEDRGERLLAMAWGILPGTKPRAGGLARLPGFIPSIGGGL